MNYACTSNFYNKHKLIIVKIGGIFAKFERLKLTNWAVKEFCCLIQEDKLN